MPIPGEDDLPYMGTGLEHDENWAAGRAGLRVFDLAGRLVRTLAEDESLAAGEHRRVWDGKDRAGRPASAGVYLVRLETRSGVDARKLTLVR